jgi:L-ascorbate metabolism protein UlaG (beta-lactamase superfamily)
MMSDRGTSAVVPWQEGLFFVGNATTVICHGGFTLLTDPNFLHRGQRAYLGYGLTTVRRRDPALSTAQLPELDAIVLSHMHGDHWDRVAQRGLDRRLPVITTPHAARRLHVRGFRRAQGLRTWERRMLVKDDRMVRITSLPGRHAPGRLRRLLPPVMGSLLEFGTTGGEVDLRLYISGDTLMGEEVREIARRYPDIDVGVVHLGGTMLLGLLMVTMDGRQGCDWLQTVPCTWAIPVHYDDYTAFKSPLSDFQREVDRRGLSERVRYVQPGQSTSLLRRNTPS